VDKFGLAKVALQALAGVRAIRAVETAAHVDVTGREQLAMALGNADRGTGHGRAVDGGVHRTAAAGSSQQQQHCVEGPHGSV